MNPDLINLSTGALNAKEGSAHSTIQSDSLNTLAKAVVARQPEQILQLSLPSLPSMNAVKINLSATELLSGKPPDLAVAKTPDGRALVFDLSAQQETKVLSAKESATLFNKLAEAMAKGQLSLSSSQDNISLRGAITQVAGRQISIQLYLPGKPEVNVKINQSSTMKIGEPVTLNLTVDTQKKAWKGSLSLPNSGTAVAMEKMAAADSVPKLAIAKQLASQGLSVEGKLSTQLNTLLAKAGRPADDNFTVLNLKLSKNELRIRSTSPQAVAQIPLNEAQIRGLPQLSEKLVTALNINEKTGRLVQANVVLTAADTKQSDATLTLSGKEKESTEAKLVRDGEIGAQTRDKILQLSRQLLADTGSTRTALSQLLTALQSPGSLVEGGAKQLANQIFEQLTKGASETAEIKTTSSESLPRTERTPTNTNQMQQLAGLLTSQALVTTPSNILNPPIQSGFINGLMTLLQVSLAGRAIRQQPDLSKLADKTDSVISRSVQGAAPTASPSRVASEFAQLDSRFQTIASLKTLLANYQQQKLQNGESRLQGQDTLYYLLPVGNDKQAPPEILLRAEERETAHDNDKQNASRVWNLTMKLDIGQLGELLVKSKIRGEELELHLYTSTDPLLNQVWDTLPFLLTRLRGLGLTVEHHSCQRGKIPSTLKDAPYQLFEARV